MHQEDRLPEHLGWIEAVLRTGSPDLPRLRICAQSHYGPPDRIAFVDVYGVEDDRNRRRQIRTEANDLLRRLGYVVEIESGRDIYDVRPIRPVSAHDEIRMLRCLHAACDRAQ
ncbi:hypothetical protein LCGC14_1587280 [marine sediment metagenome]|uniref:Uncharacterized protein n=1 Tax=marine sediment metagenome TaxID=412755 RepID=A0A0F9IF08_9ZZZZ